MFSNKIVDYTVLIIVNFFIIYAIIYFIPKDWNKIYRYVFIGLTTFIIYFLYNKFS
jgi:hypothetical protein